MKYFTASLYFLIAIVILAALGVIFPLIFDLIKNDLNILNNLTQNIITYSMPILVISGIDLSINIIDRNVSYKKPVILSACLVVIFALGLSSYILYNCQTSKIDCFQYLSIIVIILAYALWWVSNYNNSSFSECKIDASLGGNASNGLNNG